jgi:hypothetical protein
MPIPTTQLESIQVNNGGIEYNGSFFISSECNELPLSCKELWFVAKNQAHKNEEYLAKLWSTKCNLGCVYDMANEDKLKNMTKNLPAIKQIKITN